MKWLIGGTAGCLIGIGGLMLLIPLFVVLGGELDDEESRSAAFGGLFLGIPPVALGSAMGWGLYRHQQRQRQLVIAAAATEIQAQFYKLLKAQEGEITVLQFATATGLAGNEAKAYLNERAQEFGADFQVTDQGEIIYQFSV